MEQVGISMWEQNKRIREEFTDTVTKMMGWEVEYYLTEPENPEITDKYEFSKVIDRNE